MNEMVAKQQWFLQNKQDGCGIEGKVFESQKGEVIKRFSYMYNIVTFNRLCLAALYWNLFCSPDNKQQGKSRN